jgi:UPF0755 protein
MNRKKIIISISIILGIFLIAFCLPKNPFSKERVVFVIERGEGSKDISINLKQGGFVWWSSVFRFYAITRGISGRMQAGIYELSSNMSVMTIAEKFAGGKIATQNLTVPEGYTSEQIFEKLKNLVGFNAELDTIEKLTRHEGYLFPDTYKIPYAWTMDGIIKLMTDNFAKKTASLKITPDIITMASILEKELKTQADKEIASGLLWKRIDIGMALQVDSCMWTYDNRGLPESPICNPGLESILAALNPEASAYWYYLSRPDGETVFSKTFEEHKAAKAKYLK